MTTARAARLTRHGEPLAIEDVALPQPGPDEQLVTLAFGGVNPVDRYNAQGVIASDGPLPRTIGGEASGWTVDGQLVVVAGSGLGMFRDGLYATHAVVPNFAVVPVPAGISPEVASAVGIAGLTAFAAANIAAPEAGESVLVLGAGGGVGLPLVSYLTSLGARVYGQVGTATKAAAVRAAGAVEVVVADAASLTDSLNALSPTGTFAPNAVIDPLGGGFVRPVVDMLAVGGRYVVYGTSAGNETQLNWQTMYRKGLRISGYGGLAITAEQRRAGLIDTLPVVARGDMRIPIDQIYPLAGVNEAFSALADRTVTGKVILDLRS